jgi:Ca-activated chloride channel family protein
MNGQRPPKDAVRVEEMINYFSYDYPAPHNAGIPFKTTTHVVKSPWNADSYLLEIGIKGYEPPKSERPAANLVFLIDVSGSMADPDKLPLLKSGMKLLTDQLTERDKVSIVVYAGNAGVVLEPTSGKDKDEIADALQRLEAGGSTAGGEGIQLAYSLAKKARIEGGINRIILATDGDFNVGVTDIDQLKGMIEDSRKLGISLTTLGFGEGNYNDELMEQLADVGNGNYGYIDSLKEAKRLLVDQLDATIQTIAKDVKIQVEFNPAVVAQYRLIGYENRALMREDFNNDKKDAGEIGAGHTVTAIYEIALVGSKGLAVDPLRYGAPQTTAMPTAPIKPSEFAFLRLRYKDPEGDQSKLIEAPLRTEQLNDPTPGAADLDFAAAVAAFGQLLRGGDYLGKFGYDQIADLARQSRGTDDGGYRAEFIDLVELAKSLGDS